MRGVLVSIAICATVATSRADTTAAKKAEAEIIFNEAVKLREAGQLAEACAKFAHAYDLDEHAVGSLLNVALCDEKAGKVASAQRKFTDAKERAKDQGLTEHEKAAQDHLETLAPQVPYLKLTFAESLPDMKVVIDDAVVDPQGDLPLDPGSRTVLVTAPGRLPYQTKLDLALGEHKAFTVPRLARSVTVKSSRRTIGKVFTVSGVVGAAVGVGLGLYGRHLYNAQLDARGPGGQKLCVPDADGNFDVNCPADQHAQTDRARLLGNFGSVIGGLGIVAIGVGVYFWMRAPSETAPRVSVVPSLTPESIGLAAIGRF